MKRLAIVGVAALALAGCGSTALDTGSPPSARAIRGAEHRAREHWVKVPCNRQIDVGVATFIDPTILAQASWQGGTLPFHDCTVRFTPTIVRYGWRVFCTVMVHEFGHLLGHVHSKNPNSVMNPMETSDNQPPACHTTPKGLKEFIVSDKRTQSQDHVKSLFKTHNDVVTVSVKQ